METVIHSPQAVEILRDSEWASHGIDHGFFGRAGGVSQGTYASLNLSAWVGDDPAAVRTNWSRAEAIIGPHQKIALLNQVHGAVIHRIRAEYCGGRLLGDGMVASQPGVMLGVMTADCVPILMADAENMILGALHAGWRGTLAGIATAGVHAMRKAGAMLPQIQVALGPAIGQCCYEVDDELGARFESEYQFAGRHITAGARPGKAMLDLRGIIADQFVAVGLAREAVWYAGPCTRCANDRFFSRRGAGGVRCGLQLSFIGTRVAR
ncbi:MAG: peptidoglycan editing factor PgeF [Candidatus Binataceae bacterium]